MWLKKLVADYSNELVAKSRPRVGMEPAWLARQGVSIAEASRLFQNKVMVPLAQHLSRDLDLQLQIAPGGGSTPSFRLLCRNGEEVGRVYMANPHNARGFFRYPNGRSLEIHSYSILLMDLQKQWSVSKGVEVEEATERKEVRVSRGRGR